MQLYAKCRQSARLFLQPSELRLPHPLARMRVCSPSFGSLRERGWGFPIQTRGQTLWYLPIYTLCVHRHGGGKLYTDNLHIFESGIESGNISKAYL